MAYTQDESYYLLDAAPTPRSISACARHRSLPDGAELKRAQNGDRAFDAEKFVNRWPAKKHDHFLIPAGTIHCSGANSVVLEISATPYIFTFKLWDWGRLGLDNHPRPIHLQHGLANIQWDRDTEWVRTSLINKIQLIDKKNRFTEEHTGLHAREFIDTRRHWFSAPVSHDTNGGVQVLNLVEGESAMVESPQNRFAPFEVHYAETFIVPAAVGKYRASRTTRRPVRHDPRLGANMNETFDPGFDIRATSEPLGFIYGPGTFGPTPGVRSLDAIRPSLRQPDCDGPDPVYAIAMDVGRASDRPDWNTRKMLYGAVSYAAGRLGDEPVRSQGHVHRISSHSGWSPPEVYEIWTGKAFIYMQERVADNPGRCFAIRGRARRPGHRSAGMGARFDQRGCPPSGFVRRSM